VDLRWSENVADEVCRLLAGLRRPRAADLSRSGAAAEAGGARSLWIKAAPRLGQTASAAWLYYMLRGAQASFCFSSMVCAWGHQCSCQGCVLRGADAARQCCALRGADVSCALGRSGRCSSRLAHGRHVSPWMRNILAQFESGWSDRFSWYSQRLGAEIALLGSASASGLGIPGVSSAGLVSCLVAVLFRGHLNCGRCDEECYGITVALCQSRKNQMLRQRAMILTRSTQHFGAECPPPRPRCSGSASAAGPGI
jgi:hypothetical protein